MESPGSTRPRGTVVITGASTGIGEACALHLSELGFSVFAGIRKEEDGDRLRRAAGGRVVPLRLDVTDAEQIAAAAERVRASLDGERLSGVVSNAGIAVAGPLEFLPLNELRRQFEVNTIGPVAVVQAFLPMLRTSRGRVVLIGSVSGVMSAPFVGAYCASKFAVEAIADAMRMELKPWAIDVVLIDPGEISTPIWEKGQALAEALMGEAPPEFHRLYGPAVPKAQAAAEKASRRGRPPKAVAEVVARALTDRRPKARYLVGTDARIQAAVARLLPSRWKDRLVLRVLGM